MLFHRAAVPLLLVLASAVSAADAPDKAEPKPRGRLLFFGVAYDEAPPKGFTVDHYNYAPDNFANLLAAQSKDLFTEVKIATVKGNAATRDAIMAKLRALRQSARKEDVVLLYWGTHGGTDAQGWSANLPRNGNIRGSDIKDELGKMPCLAMVLISTCGSGGFVRPTAAAIDLPANMAAFAACRRQQSTNNELDVSFLEALAGFGDADGNGVVTLQEAIDYVPRRYRELVRGAGEDQIPVLGHADAVPLDRPLTKVNGSHAAVLFDGAWYGATVLSSTEGKSKVRFLGWDPTTKTGGFAFPDATVTANQMHRPTADSPAIEVKWNGEWYPAVIREKKREKFHIHYMGYPDSDDETVGPDRVRYVFGKGAGESAGGKRRKQ